MRYLEIGVKCPPDNDFTMLTKRTPLTSTPSSLVAQQALAAPWSGLTGIPTNLAFLNSPSCTNSQVAKWNSTTTTWACGDITVGTDTLAGLTCAADQIVKRNSANTAWECAADTADTTTAGDGLTLTGTALSVNFAQSGGNNGTATTVARSDHTHAAPTAIDNVPIGATTASTGKFTTLEATTSLKTPALETGSLKVTGGSPAVGSVLTADASGNATWQPASGKLANIIYVAKSGGDFTTITAALDSITDAAANSPYLIRVAPGVYEEQVTMKEYVSIEGAGEGITIIKGTSNLSGSDFPMLVEGSSNAELRYLTVQSVCASTTDCNTNAIYNFENSPTLSHLTIIASGGSTNRAVMNEFSYPVMSNLTITASGESAENIGVFNNASKPTIYNSRIAGSTKSVLNISTSTPKIANTMLSGIVDNDSSASSTCIGAYDASFAALDATCQPPSQQP